MKLKSLCGLQLEKPALERIMAVLEQGKGARSVPLSDAERLAVKGLQLLTMKPLIYAVNVAEGDLADKGAQNHHVAALGKQAAEEGSDTVVVSAQVQQGAAACQHAA